MLLTLSCAAGADAGGVVHNDSDAKDEAEPEPAKTKTTTAAAFCQLLDFFITHF